MKGRVKISVFADDMIVYLSNPQNYMREHLNLIDNFRKVVGSTGSTGQTLWSSLGLDYQQRIHKKGPMAAAMYVAEDGPVAHQWEELPLVLMGFDAPL